MNYNPRKIFLAIYIGLVGTGAEGQGDQAVRVPGQDPHDGGGGGRRGRAWCYPRQRGRQGIVISLFISLIYLCLYLYDFSQNQFCYICFDFFWQKSSIVRSIRSLFCEYHLWLRNRKMLSHENFFFLTSPMKLRNINCGISRLSCQLYSIGVHFFW